MKDWRQSRQAAYKARKPWVRLVEWARRRCNDTNQDGPNYWHYQAKGIICDLTAAQVEAAWKRDNAHLLKRPSLDRKDATKNYTFDNIRVIEYMTNIRMPHNAALADETTPAFV